MPRTKKTKPRQSSLLPGCTLGQEQIRYLECLVSELECTVERNCQAVQSAVDRIYRSADMWYDNIIRTVPDEILNRPFKEVWDSSVPLPKALPSSTTVSTVLPSPTDTELPSDTKPLTATRLRQKAVVASAKAKRAGSQRRSIVSKKKATDEMPSAARPAKKVRKMSGQTPISHNRRAGGMPVVTPKFDIRKRPPTARQARRGETLLSVSGSPVEAKPLNVPIHVHINNGQVVKVVANDTNDPSLKELCKAIKNLCDKV